MNSLFHFTRLSRLQSSSLPPQFIVFIRCCLIVHYPSLQVHAKNFSISQSFHRSLLPPVGLISVTPQLFLDLFRSSVYVLVFHFFLIFTALHGMQTQSSDENSVRPSISLSVKRVDCDKTEEKSVQTFIPNERSFSLVF